MNVLLLGLAKVLAAKVLALLLEVLLGSLLGLLGGRGSVEVLLLGLAKVLALLGLALWGPGCARLGFLRSFLEALALLLALLCNLWSAEVLAGFVAAAQHAELLGLAEDSAGSASCRGSSGSVGVNVS